MKNLIILSGAGVSAESGIQTFRDGDGLWENHRIEDVATPEAWARNPELVQRFYNMRRQAVISAQPNAAHSHLSQLQEKYNVQIITQNIDDLHERAGSKFVLHLHGNIRIAKSSGPNQEQKYYPVHGDSLNLDSDFCDDGYPLRPHVVWFGEAVPMLDEAAELCLRADIFLVIGTSLKVYPAASLIHAIPSTCEKIVLDPSTNQLGLDSSFTQIRATAVEGLETLKTLL